MANEGAPAPDLTVGPRALAILLPLFALALVVYAVRICSRSLPKPRLNLSDYTISVAVLAETITITLTAVAVSHGYGRPRSVLSPDEREIIGRTTYAVFLISLWASAFARISISCLLLHITTSRLWKLVLWTNIGFQILALGSCDIVQLLQCRPIRANWALVPDGYCFPQDQVWIVVCLFGAIGMAGDVLCAILPIFIIWRLSRSVVEKVLVSILLGLGMVAASGGVLKLVILKSWDPFSPTASRDIMEAFIWIRVEELVLIIGACAPTLKVPIEGVLQRRFGLPRPDPIARELNSVHTMHTMPDESVKPKPCQWNRSRGSSSGASSGQGSSSKGSPAQEASSQV